MTTQEQNIDLTTLSIEQLKALAYDQKITIETAQRNLQIIEDELGRKMTARHDKKNSITA